MRGKSYWLTLAVSAALSGSVYGQQTTFFETGATRAGQIATGWSNPTSFQYPYLGTLVEGAASGAFAPSPPRSPDGSRLIADGLITRSANDGGVMNRISASLPVNDADVFKIQVTNPLTFSAQIGTLNTSTGVTFGATASLFLFDENGNAIRGGTSRLDNSATTPANEAAKVTLTLPSGSPSGFYWVGISRNVTATDQSVTDVIVPRNAANELLFDESLLLANPGTVYDVLGSVSSPTLSTDRTQSWQVTPFDNSTLNPADPAVQWTTNSTSSPVSYNIFLTGAQYAVIPEPASMGLLAGLGAMLIRRRAR